MTREHAGSKLTIEHAGSQANTLVLSEICRYNPIPWSAAAYNSIYKHVRQLQAPPISLAESSAETTHKPHGGSDTCKNVTSLPKYGVLLTPKYGQKKVPYAEMRFLLYSRTALWFANSTASGVGRLVGNKTKKTLQTFIAGRTFFAAFSGKTLLTMAS